MIRCVNSLCTYVFSYTAYGTSSRMCLFTIAPTMGWDSHLQADADRGTLHIVHRLGTKNVITLVTRLHGRARLAMDGLVS